MPLKSIHLGPRGRKVWGIFFGQIISLLLALAGLFSNEIASAGVEIPIGQCLPMYCVLLFAHIPNIIKKGGFRNAKPKNKWWMYLIAGILDSQALTTTVIAYQNASLSLVTLLQLLSLPSAMVGSLIFKTARYKLFHYITGLLATIGMIVSVALNASFLNDSVLGGILGAVGAIIYGLMNSIAEKYLQACSQFEYLAYLSSFAIPFVVIETCAIELNGWENATWTGAAIGWEIGYIVDVVSQYILIAIFVSHYPVTILNMSFLTTSIYGMILDAFVLGGEIKWYTIVCAVWIIVFTALFASKPPIQLVKGVPKDKLGEVVESGDVNEGDLESEARESQSLVGGERRNSNKLYDNSDNISIISKESEEDEGSSGSKDGSKSSETLL